MKAEVTRNGYIRILTETEADDFALRQFAGRQIWIVTQVRKGDGLHWVEIGIRQEPRPLTKEELALLDDELEDGK